MLCFMKILDNPPLPLTRYYFDAELEKEKTKMIDKLFIESSYKSNNSLNKLFNKVKSGESIGDFKLQSEDNTYYVHSWIIEEYEFFNNIIKFNSDSSQLDCCDEVIKLFIEFLYTKKFDYNNEYIEELKFLAIYTCIDELIQICDIILNNIDYNKKYKIDKHIERAKKWIMDIEQDYKDKSKHILDFLKVESLVLYNAIQNDDKNSTIECILKIKNYILQICGNDGIYRYRFENTDDKIYRTVIGGAYLF